MLAPGQDPADRLDPLHRPGDATGPELHHHARRDPARRNGPVPVRRDLHASRLRAPRSSNTPATTRLVPPTRSPPTLHRPSRRRAATAATPICSPTAPTGVGAVLARTVGFATVSLQMRGTGCSGGAFDLFGYPSDYDAYDAIEIVAHQPWVAHHKVGMVGISYSGLSQLPSAGTDPPDLAAIAPMSPTDDLFSTGYPGGIYNDGFAASWISERIDDAMAAASYSDGHLPRSSTSPVANVGQRWTYYEIDAELAASRGSLVHLSGQSGSPQPGRGPREPRRSPDRRARHRSGTGSVPLRPTFHGPIGPPRSKCPCSSREPSRTSRPGPSGRR